MTGQRIFQACPRVFPISDAIAPRDLSTPTDVHDLVVAFYREVVFDDLLEPVFGEVAEVDWAEHIPRLIAYWQRIIFGSVDYGGTVTATHRHLHTLEAIRPEHCERWYALWVRCVRSEWSGPNAEHAVRHAELVMAGLARRVFGYEWAPPAASILDAGAALGGAP